MARSPLKLANELTFDLRAYVTDIAALKAVRWTDGASGQAQSLVAAGVNHRYEGIGSKPPPKRHHAKQVHGTHVIEASERTTHATETRAEADAVYTRRPGECVSVKTADCVPLLLWDQKRRAAMAVHAGWRGLTAGIIGQGVRTLATLGVAPRDLLVAIGPAIGRERFEVGEEVVEALRAKPSGLTPAQALLCISKGKKDRWHIDLAVAAALSLINADIPPTQVEVLQICTYTTSGVWHSARREGPRFGSNWHWIEL